MYTSMCVHMMIRVCIGIYKHIKRLYIRIRLVFVALNTLVVVYICSNHIVRLACLCPRPRHCIHLACIAFMQSRIDHRWSRHMHVHALALFSTR